MSKKIDLKGKIFGFWTVLHEHPGREKSTLHWVCRCHCGLEKPVSGINLRGGTTVSCGCVRSMLPSATITHGMSKSRVYKIWAGMVQRATNPRRTSYRNYGARGITVCSRWLNFENFYADMGEPHGAAYSLDRVDNDGVYSKENCRWATATEQNRNSRNCKLTASSASAIRSNLADGQTVAHVARTFFVSESLVRAIRDGEVWQRIETEGTAKRFNTYAERSNSTGPTSPAK